jgi:hypothetical protein
MHGKLTSKLGGCFSTFEYFYHYFELELSRIFFFIRLKDLSLDPGPNFWDHYTPPELELPDSE